LNNNEGSAALSANPQVPRPQKAAKITAQHIVREIDRRQLKPGDRLAPERVMLDELGIGRGTLREALRFLEFQGVVELKPGPSGGPVIRFPEASILSSTIMLLLQFRGAPFRVIVESRMALEPVTAFQATDRISDEQLDVLRSSVDDLERSMEDRSKFLEASHIFHETIATASGNALFDCLVSSLRGILDGSVLGIDYPRHRRMAILKDHRLILSAISAGKSTEAQDLMRDHMYSYLTYAEAKYPEILEQKLIWDNFSE
jgi:DNA-binding FadR family transcriptional regulator